MSTRTENEKTFVGTLAKMRFWARCGADDMAAGKYQMAQVCLSQAIGEQAAAIGFASRY